MTTEIETPVRKGDYLLVMATSATTYVDPAKGTTRHAYYRLYRVESATRDGVATKVVDLQYRNSAPLQLRRIAHTQTWAVPAAMVRDVGAVEQMARGLPWHGWRTLEEARDALTAHKVRN